MEARIVVITWRKLWAVGALLVDGEWSVVVVDVHGRKLMNVER